MQPISAPVTICGDIHGQFWDVHELLRQGGMVPGTSYIFMVSKMLNSYPGLGHSSENESELITLCLHRATLSIEDITAWKPFPFSWRSKRGEHSTLASN